ncbi:small redox-active disulfide protein 2 [Thermosipho japonicus]|uniref:Small redox-active disulfide protein 2 n=1 Tax=Thermosipho japonicus TaxID=90323 RepID=A0A841GKJ7_9BACT|nr:thioredoxin family protein [Thermosipho japonicus]MBB6062917.1 small redox-active disulfide protein 2 [Thermosipho japonicus]
MAKKIEILGSGCPRCKQTEKIMKMAVEELNIDATIEKVQDINEIISRGVAATPAVAIDGKIVISGKIPKLEEAKKLLQ